MAPRASWSDETFARRPWLSFYLPSEECKLAQRISITADSDGDAADSDGDSLLPFDLWTIVAACLPQFASICRLARTCQQLRPLGWHQQTWEARARAQRREGGGAGGRGGVGGWAPGGGGSGWRGGGSIASGRVARYLGRGRVCVCVCVWVRGVWGMKARLCGWVSVWRRTVPI